MKILITGGTGFLGTYLVKDLSAQCSDLYVLSRKKTSEKFFDLTNVQWLEGDITNQNVLFDDSFDLDSIDVVIHAAALYDMEASYSQCFLQNVTGTQNVLDLIKKMKNLKAFYYISTVAVGDPDSNFLYENQLTQRDYFVDAYSETKFLAEKIVRNNVSVDYVTRIIRPGIIVGDSVTGEMPKIDGPYYFIQAFKKFAYLLRPIPVVPLSFNPSSELPIIPVDHCSRFIALLVKREESKLALKTYHLISFKLPTIKMLLSDLNQMSGIKTRYLPVKRNFFHDLLLKRLGIPKEVIPFMFSKLSYDMSSTLEDLPEIKESMYSSFKNSLFKK